MTAAGDDDVQSSKTWRWSVGGFTFLIVALISTYLLDKYDIPYWTSPHLAAFVRYVLCVGAIAGLLVCLGLARVGKVAGVLVNSQNLMSLSRLQTALWTVLVLGFFSAVALARLAHGVAGDPLAIAVGSDLWGLLGISSASLVGTPLLLSIRRDRTPTDAASASAAAAMGGTPAAIDAQIAGPLYRNPTPSAARLSDIFEGDEISNTDLVDLAKVQMFVFTVVSALVWTVAATHLLWRDCPFAADIALPSLPSGMVTLLGVSNAGYLANKMVDHTQTKATS